MADRIIADIGRIDQAGRQMAEQAAEYVRLCEQMYRDVDIMGAAWKGSDNQAFVSKVNAYRADFSQVLANLSRFSGFLADAARSYRQTQQTVTQAAASLPSGAGGSGSGFFISVPDQWLMVTQPYPLPGVLPAPISVGPGVADRIAISLSEVSSCASRIRSTAGRLEGKLHEIQQTMNGLADAWESDAADTIRARMNALVSKIDGYRGTPEAYASFLDRTVAQYQTTEAKIRSGVDGIG